MYIELIGYLGSLLIVISMLMTSLIRLRLINAIGSIIFTGYALAIRSYPTAILNFTLVIINIYNLLKLLRSKHSYEVTKLSMTDGFVKFFLDTCENDIRLFFPSLDRNFDYNRVYLVTCGVNPVGLFLGKSYGENSIEALIDYATPAYRDCSIGKHLYNYLKTNENIKELAFENPSAGHEPYLLKVGFKKNGNRYIKEL